MSSPTVRVEKATSDLLIGPDWTMNMDICDSVNSNHWQAKEVVKAVKKRLQNKNPKVQLLALTLLETMIKNCGDYVHHQVAERNILAEMIKIVKKKSDMHVRDKILVLLDSWQEAFGGPGGKFPQYYWAYDELRRSGVGFPQRSANAAPIFTPPATHPTDRLSQAGYGMPSNTARRLDEAMASETENLNLSNLDSMRSVMELLNDMLQAVNPNDREAIKDEVIVDLVSQCRSNQKKLMQLLNSTGDEELLGQGLELNDNIQGLLAKHDAIASGSPLPAETTGSGHGPTTPTAAVADLPLSKTLSSGPEGNAVVASSAVVSERIEEEEEDEDDDFAQLARRRSKARPVPSDGTYNGTFSVTATASGTSASSAPIDSNALVLSNPPHPVRTTNKEQDIIDLLSLTLTTSGSSPHTPLTPPTSLPQTPPSNSNQTGPVAHNEQGYPYATQPYPMNQGQVPYSYVVPWAQPQTQPQPQAQAHPQFQTQSQVPENSYGYPPPPWASATNNHYNPSPSSSPYSYQGARTDTGSPYASRALQQHNSFSSRGNSFPVSQGSPSAARPLQHYNSFGSRTNNLPASLKEAQVNPTVGHGAPTMGNKPFVPSYRLFEDLIDLRSSGVKSNGLSQTSSLSGSAGQSMVGGRK